jgi:myo-inositol-1(or 4)-monophosphatase
MDKSNHELLEIAKDIALIVGKKLRQEGHLNKNFVFDQSNIKEIKADLDTIAEKIIIDKLKVSGLSILSEEAGFIGGDLRDSRRWIIDPIDGTFNYMKDLGPCAVSIGLWDKDSPVFGVIFALNTGDLYWGGKEFGAFCNLGAISVSNIADVAISSVCTGFPVRLDMESQETAENFWHSISKFSKVRMIGSASMSLVYVAKGSSDVYLEDEIMIWDVAAGLAIVEGAGGVISIDLGTVNNALRVSASNERLSHDAVWK